MINAICVLVFLSCAVFVWRYALKKDLTKEERELTREILHQWIDAQFIEEMSISKGSTIKKVKRIYDKLKS